jgi:hypothetical protein
MPVDNRLDLDTLLSLVRDETLLVQRKESVELVTRQGRIEAYLIICFRVAEIAGICDEKCSMKVHQRSLIFTKSLK